jgi:hypothetical protein
MIPEKKISLGIFLFLIAVILASNIYNYVKYL